MSVIPNEIIPYAFAFILVLFLVAMKKSKKLLNKLMQRKIRKYLMMKRKKYLNKLNKNYWRLKSYIVKN